MRAFIKKWLPLLAAVSCLQLGQSNVLAAHIFINMSGFSFSPASATIGVGDTVTWSNTVATSHNTASGDAFCGTNLFWHSPDFGFRGTYSVTFTNFAPGTYTYNCTIHCASFGMKGTLVITNAPNTPPTVSISGPANGAKFAAPGMFTLSANATDSDGTVTNVTFFQGGAPLGNVIMQPFDFSVSNLAAGNYSFSATATDNRGAATPSTPVQVFILTNATLLSPQWNNGAFQFTISGIAGQTYISESSANLSNWTAIATNVAPADTFNVSDPAATNGQLKTYRVRQDLSSTLDN